MRASINCLSVWVKSNKLSAGRPVQWSGRTTTASASYLSAAAKAAIKANHTPATIATVIDENLAIILILTKVEDTNIFVYDKRYKDTFGMFRALRPLESCGVEQVAIASYVPVITFSELCGR